MTRAPDTQTHVFRHCPEFPAEREILSALLPPGMRVLDVGTAATGRSARLLRELGADVVSIDFNPAAIDEFAQTGDRRLIQLAAADLCALPFPARSFGLVLVAFHGMDYLLDEEARQQAFREAYRVLQPGGACGFATCCVPVFCAGPCVTLQVWSSTRPRRAKPSMLSRQRPGFISVS